MTLLDSWMPEYDTTATYSTTVNAPADVVYQAILATDFSRHPLVALLMGIRMLPGLLVAPRETLRRFRTRRTGGRDAPVCARGVRAAPRTAARVCRSPPHGASSRTASGRTEPTSRRDQAHALRCVASPQRPAR